MDCRVKAALLGAVPFIAILVMSLAGCGGKPAGPAAAAQDASAATPGAAAPDQGIALTPTQLRSIGLMAVSERTFTVERQAVGTIDFDEDMSVQVSPPYQGRIVQLLAKEGDQVRKGQTLFTIDSPDLVQAESTLIGAAGVLRLTSSALKRAEGLFAVQGIAQKDYEQTVSDQQAAEGAYRAARNAVRIFGKSDAEIDQIVEQRRIDAQMPVRSPISGAVTARNAAPGTLVQPGGSPAPYAVADLSTKWMLASIPEADMPLLRLGEAVDVKLLAYPDRSFHGRVTNISAAVDPNTHCALVRSEIRDLNNELRPRMFATFTLHTGDGVRSVGVPQDGVVREGDGSMSVWVTVDRRRFTRRTVKLGMQQAGFDQVLDGLSPGEMIAGSGALFISNAAVQGAAE